MQPSRQQINRAILWQQAGLVKALPHVDRATAAELRASQRGQPRDSSALPAAEGVLLPAAESVSNSASNAIADQVSAHVDRSASDFGASTNRSRAVASHSRIWA